MTRRRLLVEALGVKFAALSSLLVLGCATTSPSWHQRDASYGFETAAGAPSVSSSDVAELRQNLANADLVFVGRFSRANHRWLPFSGSIAPVWGETRFHDVRVLRGEERRRRLSVLVMMLDRGPYLEVSGAGIRLSRDFFVRGHLYLVLAMRTRVDPGDVLKYQVVGTPSMGVWPATAENVAALRDLIAPASERQ
jgi:hypothetical protein